MKWTRINTNLCEFHEWNGHELTRTHTNTYEFYKWRGIEKRIK